LGLGFYESPFREIIPPFHFCETAICFAGSMFIVVLAVLWRSISGKVFRILQTNLFEQRKNGFVSQQSVQTY